MNAFHPAYIAGFIDGEGTIRIARTKRGDRRSQIRYDIVVSIGNTCLEPLLGIQGEFGGSIHTRKPRLGRKQAYDWVIGCKLAIVLLNQILPYLVIKKPQALLAIAFDKDRPKLAGNRYFQGPEQAYAFREAYFSRMKELNK